ncbi:MAG: phospho-N-acetylmuramoyl-pentapeptide-transferase [Planctomycetota bacterium]
MCKWLARLEDVYGPLRVFDSITFRAALGMVSAFLIALLIGPRFIRFLSGLRVIEDVDKPHSATLEALHRDKGGTPTMGGLLLVSSILLGTLLFANLANPYVWAAVFALVGFAGLGFADDYVKLRRIGRHQGLRGWTKFGLQMLLALALAGMLCRWGDRAYATKIVLPGTKMETFLPDLGLFYVPFVMIVLAGVSNAVNLTDGLDGLAAGLTTLVTFTFMVLAYAVGHREIAGYLRIPHVAWSGELTVFCAITVGATLGFLWFNAHPARVFMGNTGSLALGGVIGFVALAIKQEFVLLIAGGVFVLEAISVILQVGSFQMTGRRLFRCAPFHHHLQFSGWKENHVVVRLWCIGIMLTALALATLKMH